MELIVFDLDGTLLNRSGELSPFTRETLSLMATHNIAYTVATGRTLHASRDLLAGRGFNLPHIYKNGVVIWDPAATDYTFRACLTLSEIEHVLEAVFAQNLAPFVFTLEPLNQHAVYFAPSLNETEQKLKAQLGHRHEVPLRPLSELPADALITNISALGLPSAIKRIEAQISDEARLVAYAGTAMEGDSLRWIDIHHTNGSKGSAVESLRRDLKVDKVICFGDGDNDLSMFECADESYAPANAEAEVKAAASQVIGHHDEDGIARFLRERLGL